MTTAQQIEIRALRVVDRIINSRPAEDDLVECKAEWPEDHRKAARQIAALCNTARGEDAMWLIGVNERLKNVTPADVTELANWWPKVEKYFGDRISPDLRNLIVPTSHGDIVALNFGTSRVPYLVSTDGTGGVEFEIPIRSGNKTRTAHRHEIMIMLSEQVDAPIIEIIYCKVQAWMETDEKLTESPQSMGDIRIRFDGGIFVSTTHPITIPYHRLKATINFPGGDASAKLRLTAKIASSSKNESTVGFRNLAGGFYFDASDGVALYSSASMPRNLSEPVKNASSISIEIEFHVAGRDRPVRVRQELNREPPPSDRESVRSTQLGSWTVETS
ncbi:hypothetical protein [Rhodococcus erythropolis]|uniref:hypothetical protein n=1 Tax=Rhodococcus erythropolis TaxID=1833 RepID=UPI0036D89BE3